MVALYLSNDAVRAAREVDPNVSLAAVNAASEVTVAEELREAQERSAEENEQRIAELDRYGPAA